jgi:exodeoxyribonuclease VII large subunit
MHYRIYSVSELTKEIKETLETSFPRLWVEGEISNFKKHSSGHLYFTLKDNTSQIRCAMWRFRAGHLLFRPEDGLKVVVQGDLQVYEVGGNYQIIIHQIQPAGIGDLQLAFEQLKKRLHSEGLFADSHKKPIPRYPETIGIITSPTGAAVRDIVSVIFRRYPNVNLILNPVRVQGPGAKEEIVQAINDFNRYGNVDVIIIGRGGGSLEDLWAFNEEIVARAIFHSKIPTISAVGHEVDFSIADFVADKRAPTPSVAAEFAVPDLREVQGILAYYSERMSNTVLQNIRDYRIKIQNLQKSYAFRRPKDVVFQKMQRVDELTKNLQLGFQINFTKKKQKFQALKNQLAALSPISVLQRGYSIAYKNGEVIKNFEQLQPEDLVQVKLAKGHFFSEVKTTGES